MQNNDTHLCCYTLFDCNGKPICNGKTSLEIAIPEQISYEILQNYLLTVLFKVVVTKLEEID
jgi:hypothetical protein